MRRRSARQSVRPGFGQYVVGLLMLCLVFMAVAPFRLPLLNQASVAVLTSIIYYGGVFLPETVPYVLVFALGMLFDILGGLPLGVSSFSWLVLRGMVTLYGRMFAIGAFWGVWAGFALSLGASMLASWLLVSYYYAGPWLPVGAPLLYWFMAVAFYPLLHFVWSRVRTALFGRH